MSDNANTNSFDQGWHLIHKNSFPLGIVTCYSYTNYKERNSVSACSFPLGLD